MNDKQYKQAVEIIKKANRVSATLLQTKLDINYRTANMLIERMERQKVITAPVGNTPRHIII